MKSALPSWTTPSNLVSQKSLFQNRGFDGFQGSISKRSILASFDISVDNSSQIGTEKSSKIKKNRPSGGPRYLLRFQNRDLT